ncbi:hypothetical protein GC175_17465 [bacterium]|nr:hypothetical protein [bacterium]
MGKAIGADYYNGYMLGQAQYHERRGEYAEALAVNDQVLSALRQRENSSIGGDDLSFSAETAEIRLKAALDLLSREQAVEQLNQLLAEYTQAKQVASIHYDIWHLDRNREQNRQQAAALYRRLYEEDGTFDHRRRYQELTGEALPDPPPLPSFDHHLPALSMSPEDMLAEIDEIIAGITSTQVGVE